MDFQIKKYDWCVKKKIVNDKLYTLIWNIDELMLSHIESNIVSSVFYGIDAEYGKIAKMTIYTLVGCRILILHNIIDGRYVLMVNLSCLSLFLILSI